MAQVAPPLEPDVADDLACLLARVPEGWTPVRFGGRRYGLSRTSRADGRVVTLHARDLSGVGLVSANVYRTAGGDVLRPCEMPAATVLGFLEGWTPDTAPGP